MWNDNWLRIGRDRKRKRATNRIYLHRREQEIQRNCRQHLFIISYILFGRAICFLFFDFFFFFFTNWETLNNTHRHSAHIKETYIFSKRIGRNKRGVFRFLYFSLLLLLLWVQITSCISDDDSLRNPTHSFTCNSKIIAKSYSTDTEQTIHRIIVWFIQFEVMYTKDWDCQVNRS